MKKKKITKSRYVVGSDGTIQISKEQSEKIQTLLSTAVEHSYYTKCKFIHEINPEESLDLSKIEKWKSYGLLRLVLENSIDASLDYLNGRKYWYEIIDELPSRTKDDGKDTMSIRIEHRGNIQRIILYIDLLQESFLEKVTEELVKSMVEYKPAKIMLVHILREAGFDDFLLPSNEDDDPDIYEEFFDDLFAQLYDLCDQDEFIERYRRHIKMTSRIPDFRFIFNLLEINSTTINKYLTDFQNKLKNN